MDSFRMFAGIVFLLSLFLLYDAWMKQHQPPAPVAASTSSATPTPSLPPTGTAAPGATPQPAPPAGAPPATQTVSGAAPVVVRTDVMVAEIDPVGGGLRRIELLTHKDKVEREKNFVLLQQVANHTYVAQSGLVGTDLPNHLTPFAVSGATQRELTPGADGISVEMRAKTAAGVTLVKTLTFHRGSYVIDEKLAIDNRGAATIEPFAYFQLLRDGSPAAGDSKMVPTFTGAAVYTQESKFKKVTFGDMDKGKVDYPKHARDGWIAFLQHYFVAAWLPPPGADREFYTRALGNGMYATGVILPAGKVAPGATATLDMRLYAGPQEQEKMAQLAPGLDLTVDYGWLTVIATPLFWVLSAIQKWVGNWGVAIILLTVIIKLIFYPLSAASYKSMAKMRVIAPKLQKLKEQFGDDRQRMNQAMIEMYKTEKINPLGGCLPILVQIPVFIALYWVLLASVELRNAPFFGWIKDLSAQDPYYILPVLMGATMIIQTWLNPTPPDPVQAKVMKIMPVVFSVFFFFFPAGLVLYWLVNNILSIAQQWQITRSIERSKPAHAKR
ncbi:MAG TPA: membrane protein insertase YidC [Burkholderiales bacterium]|nr:membrane protein insertase YidC [Burkholderiales bacterium]